MSQVPTPGSRPCPDWEVDFYSRPILEPDGKKRWELLICNSPLSTIDDAESAPTFRFARDCPAASVNSVWLRQSLEQALADAAQQGFGVPARLRCWRGSMRTMVQRAAEGLGLELVPSRRCYALIDWLQERERNVYPAEAGFQAGPLAPPPTPVRPMPVPLPEAARGESWNWATLPLEALAEAADWDTGFRALLPCPADLDCSWPVPGIRLFSRQRSLAIAALVAGLEPVRLEVVGQQLILEAGQEDRWLIASLTEGEAQSAAAVLAEARERGGGLQFIAVQPDANASQLDGFWMLRDLPDA
ncbi:MAG: Tab2/Atab2 family RNA-binding protein [Synechococcaceae cyanobacterium]|nr:Tab2/Atab2 family RNA-binding protein [Synechococcaceae cyanobacterium]